MNEKSIENQKKVIPIFAYPNGMQANVMKRNDSDSDLN
jgi:hypothetical protein